MSNTITFHPIGQDVLNVPSIRKNVKPIEGEPNKIDLVLEYKTLSTVVLSYAFGKSPSDIQSEYILEPCPDQLSKTVTIPMEVPSDPLRERVFITISEDVELVQPKGKLMIERGIDR